MKMIACQERHEPLVGSRPGSYLSANGRPVPSERNRLLFMDDEKIVRDVVLAIFSSAGFRVSTTATGEETIEAFRKARDASDPFDAVLLDLNVSGGMGGKETARRLREIDPTVSIILVTGSTNDPVFNDFTAYGFRYALAKPFTSKQLIQALTACFVRAAPDYAARTLVQHPDRGGRNT